MKITRFGHAAVLVEVAGSRILIDPGTFSPDETFALSGLDAIVITHQHADHLDPVRLPRLLATNRDAVLIADPQTAREQREGDWIEHVAGHDNLVGEVTLRPIGSRHAEIASQLPRIDNVGVMVSAPGEPTLFHPGDAYEYAPEGVDVLALPLSAPWAKLSETIDFLRRVNPGSYFPIHDRTISEPGYAIYWGQTVNLGGIADARRLGQRESTEISR